MPKNAYLRQLKDGFDHQIQALDLSEQQKTYLKYRWLDQVLWMENRASQTRNSYYFLKVIVILAGVILPVLVTTNPGGNLANVVRTIAVILGLVIAGLTAVEDFFNYGERWRHYRSIVEMLKAEWWRFYNRNGRYAGKTHDQNFITFANEVEDLIRLDIKTYISNVVKEDKRNK